MDLNSLKEVYVHLLRDLYSAENQLIKALPKMAKGVSNPELKKGFLQHLEQTREQAKRIEQICADLGERPTGVKCKGMEGLIEEGSETLSEKGDPASKDAAIIVDAQKIEHYEMAGYGSARTFAEYLGFTKHARLLERTLNEEKQTDERLNKVALKNVNACALEEGDDEEEMTSSRGRSASKGKSSSSRGGSKSSGGSRSASSSKSGSSAKSSSSRSSSASKSGSGSSRSGKSASASKSGGSKSGGSRSSSGGGSKSSSGSRSSSSKSRSGGGSKSKASGSGSGNGNSGGSGGNVTTDHEEIRQWVEERGGRPACVRGTGDKGDTGLLRIDYPGYSGEETLEPIEWEEFFQKFDEEKLAFLHQDETADGKTSRFSRLISRNKN